MEKQESCIRDYWKSKLCNGKSGIMDETAARVMAMENKLLSKEHKMGIYYVILLRY